MIDGTETDLENSIIWWRQLAKREMDRDGNVVAQNRAQLFERTAQSLELQRDTGIWHCVCCLKPKGH